MMAEEACDLFQLWSKCSSLPVALTKALHEEQYTCPEALKRVSVQPNSSKLAFEELLQVIDVTYRLRARHALSKGLQCLQYTKSYEAWKCHCFEKVSPQKLSCPVMLQWAKTYHISWNVISRLVDMDYTCPYMLAQNIKLNPAEEQHAFEELLQSVNSNSSKIPLQVRHSLREAILAVQNSEKQVLLKCSCLNLESQEQFHSLPTNSKELPKDQKTKTKQKDKIKKSRTKQNHSHDSLVKYSYSGADGKHSSDNEEKAIYKFNRNRTGYEESLKYDEKFILSPKKVNIGCSIFGEKLYVLVVQP